MKHHITTTLMSILIAMTMLPAPLQSAASEAPAGVPAAHYHTDNTLDVCAAHLTEEEAAFYTEKLSNQGGIKLQTGDLKLTVRIAENTGFANSGFRLWFDPEKYEPLSYSKKKSGQDIMIPAHYVDTGADITPQFSLNLFEEEDDQPLAILGWGTMALENCEMNGGLFSFFVRPKSETDPKAKPFDHLEVIQWDDANRKAVPYHLLNEGYYLRERSLLGDVDQNGIVDNVDAQLTLMVSTEMMVLGTKLADFGSNEFFEPDAVHRYPITVLAQAGDTNGDGSLDATDAQNILLHYVECKVMGQQPSTDVGSPHDIYRYIPS